MIHLPIEARGVAKTFGVSPVLRAATLNVDKGNGAIIIGRNGSGKSTLIRILAGLSSVSAGDALLFGKPARSLEPADRRRVGVVTHESYLYPNLTARENLEFYATLYGRGHRSIGVNGGLESVGLTYAGDERVRTFSRGMEQRLTFARAIIADPDVLLLDEPFAALDNDGIALVSGLIERAMSRGCATVITSHEPLQLGRLSFASYELVRGRLHLIRHDSMTISPSAPPAAAF
jgi:heme exporter protein A